MKNDEGDFHFRTNKYICHIYAFDYSAVFVAKVYMKTYLFLTVGLLILIFIAFQRPLFRGNYQTPKYAPETDSEESLWQKTETAAEQNMRNGSLPPLSLETPSSPVNINQFLSQPTMEIDANKNYEAVLHTTTGNITIALNAKKTPITANNFVALANKNFYDGTIFHRVIKGFMVQGGDPRGDGTGGPGYKFNDEPFDGEYSRGTVAMANSGPNTNGSQFFIMHADYPLPKNYVIFGKVIAGMEIVDAIAAAPVISGASGENSLPVSPVKVTSVEIVEK